MSNLQEDFYAASAKRPKESYVRTWELFHGKWFGSTVPVLPLTSPKLYGIGAMYKAGRYRSIANPLLKSMHIELGYPWTEQLGLAGRKIERSITRGIGPASQSASLDLMKVGALDLPDVPVVLGGPIGAKNLTVAASFFMLREVEISLARWQSITFDSREDTVTWLLPASKTDTQALGKSRTWGCLCKAERPSEPCPVHALLAQRISVAHALGIVLPVGTHAEDLDGYPVFPDIDGQVCQKEAVVQTLRVVAAATGIDPAKIEEVGGHAPRVAGAQHLA